MKQLKNEIKNLKSNLLQNNQVPKYPRIAFDVEQYVEAEKENSDLILAIIGVCPKEGPAWCPDKREQYYSIDYDLAPEE